MAAIRSVIQVSQPFSFCSFARYLLVRMMYSFMASCNRVRRKKNTNFSSMDNADQLSLQKGNLLVV